MTTTTEPQPESPTEDAAPAAPDESLARNTERVRFLIVVYWVLWNLGVDVFLVMPLVRLTGFTQHYPLLFSNLILSGAVALWLWRRAGRGAED
ncbi:MAG: hypothetical protein VX610_00205 [SAR324 cluster bacterium]|nr:hypothetical protein [SAR324 cluster bacterium]